MANPDTADPTDDVTPAEVEAAAKALYYGY
jgi:hypothetical protein